MLLAKKELRSFHEEIILNHPYFYANHKKIPEFDFFNPYYMIHSQQTAQPEATTQSGTPTESVGPAPKSLRTRHLACQNVLLSSRRPM